jgi:SAM-dependent methyltransferase
MKKCGLCGKEDLTLLTKELRDGVGDVWYCPECDFGILAEQVKDPERYYATEYRKTHRNAPDEETPEQIYKNTKDFQSRRLSRLRMFGKPGELLEIGCSAGQFLSQVKGHEVYGVEYDYRCREFIETELKIPVYSMRPFWQFDNVCMFQVLEHLPDPVYFMRKTRDNLKPQGRVFIEVPNLNDHLRIIPAYDKFYFHQAHNWYFTEIALRKLADMAGFNIISVEFMQDYGLRNYFHWLYKEKPIGRLGLMPEIMNELQSADELYRVAVELNGTASNIFAVWEKK